MQTWIILKESNLQVKAAYQGFRLIVKPQIVELQYTVVRFSLDIGNAGNKE